MEQKDVEKVLREFIDGKVVIGASLIRIDGKVIAAHYVGIKDMIPNLIARESLSAKRRRRIIFPVLGRLIISVAMYEKMCIGLAPVSKDQYVQLVAKSDLPFATFFTKLEEISNNIKIQLKV